MRDKTKKRLVSGEEYAWLMTKRMFLGLASLTFCILGGWVFYGAVVWVFWYPLYGLIWGLASAFFLGVSYGFYRARKSINLSMLIEKEDAHLLPQEESPVRASEIPASPQQAALLWAAQHGKEMPAEQRRRASPRDGRDT